MHRPTCCVSPRLHITLLLNFTPRKRCPISVMYLHMLLGVLGEWIQTDVACAEPIQYGAGCAWNSQGIAVIFLETVMKLVRYGLSCGNKQQPFNDTEASS